MKITYLLLYLVTTLLLFTACQKERSFESGATPSAGSLQSNVSGDCLPKTVAGIFEEGKILVATTNYIDVLVNVTKAGSYTIFTDTVNGMSFKAVGVFTSIGANTVRLPGAGTPINDGIHNFTVSYANSQCMVPVTVLPVGSGSVEAVFTLSGSPNACFNYQVAGDYIAGTALSGSNAVSIFVDVTVAGTYSVATQTSNGFSFTGAGTLEVGQGKTIVLTAAINTMPAVAGSTNFSLTTITPATTCSFVIDVAAAPTTADYFPRTAGSNWSYKYTVPAADTTFIRAKAGTVTLGGNAYTIFEATQDATAGFDDYGAYRRAGSNYHTYIDLADVISLDNSTPIDYIFLKDDVAAGATWESAPANVSIGGVPFMIKVVLKAEQKDVAVMVGTQNYPNTIVVTEKFQIQLVGGIWTDITDQVGFIRSYYSRNIGLIKQDYFQDPLTNNPTTLVMDMDLTRYEIL